MMPTRFVELDPYYWGDQDERTYAGTIVAATF